MKKQLAIFTFVGAFLFCAATAFAQDPAATTDAAGNEGFHQIMKDWFIAGGPPFMWPILLVFVAGLSISIERIISLNLARTNTKKLLARIEDALSKGGIEAAKEVTKNTRGPVASIFTQGLMRANEGVDMVEKSVTSYGGVEMGKLERGLIWISLCISLGPMLGFFGTVIGMVNSFDAIEAAGDISPQVVAAGMKVALITTVGGLVVGMVLQVLYNYLVSTIDGLVNSMEDASITLVDIIVKHNLKK